MTQCDNHEGGQIAAKHLIEAGCHKLMHISGVSENNMPADNRAIGFREICDDFDMEYVEIATNIEQYEKQEYHDLLENALRNNEGVDGIFASSDLIAAQLIQVCYKLNKKIPEDIQIIGFDDTTLATLMTPEITTIHQPIKEMATMAVDTVINASEGRMVAKRSILPVHLVKRGTTK